LARWPKKRREKKRKRGGGPGPKKGGSRPGLTSPELKKEKRGEKTKTGISEKQAG